MSTSFRGAAHVRGAKAISTLLLGASALALPVCANAAPDSEIGIAKSVSAPTLATDGTATVVYTIVVTNPNTFDIDDVQVVDDFNAILSGSTATPNSVTVTSSDFTVDHTGLADTTLLAGTETLAAGATGTITATFVLTANGQTGPFNNEADATGETVCVPGTVVGGQQGLAISQWFTDDSLGAVDSRPLQNYFDNGVDANGFNTNTDTPDNTGFSDNASNILLSAGTPSQNGGETLYGEGWVTPPCNGATTWEIRAVMGNAVGTYLAAFAQDSTPSAGNIVTAGGIAGEQHDLADFEDGNPSISSTFTAAFSSPVGVITQVDDRGSAYQLRLQERFDGGTWADIPISRYWVDKPVGTEEGGRVVSDDSDNGTNPDPTNDNGSGGVDDPTPFTLPVHAPELEITKVADDDAFVTVGQIVTYTYTVTNSGTINVRDVTVGDVHNGDGPAPTPAGETLSTDSGTTGDSTDVTADDGVWSVLAPGDVVTFTGTYIVQQADIDNLQ